MVLVIRFNDLISKNTRIHACYNFFAVQIAVNGKVFLCIFCITINQALTVLTHINSVPVTPLKLINFFVITKIEEYIPSDKHGSIFGVK